MKTISTLTDYDLAVYIVENGMCEDYTDADVLLNNYDDFCSIARAYGYHFDTDLMLWLELF